MTIIWRSGCPVSRRPRRTVSMVASSSSAGMMTSTSRLERFTLNVSTATEHLPQHKHDLEQDEHHHRDLEPPGGAVLRQIDEEHQRLLNHAQLGFEGAKA